MKKNISFKIFLAIISFISFTYAQEPEPRDPFVSLGDKMGLTPEAQEEVRLPYSVVLKGTLCSKNIFVAIVNDDIIKQGQKWRDFYVAKIERNKIVLEWEGKKFEIGLSSEEEKQPQLQIQPQRQRRLPQQIQPQPQMQPQPPRQRQQKKRKKP